MKILSVKPTLKLFQFSNGIFSKSYPKKVYYLYLESAKSILFHGSSKIKLKQNLAYWFLSNIPANNFINVSPFSI